MTYPPQGADAQAGAPPPAATATPPPAWGETPVWQVPQQPQRNGTKEPPPGPRYTSPSDASVAADTRQQVCYRAREMSYAHAGQAWDLRRSRPIGPHAFGYHFAIHDNQRFGWYLIRTAIRVYHLSEESAHLTLVLRDMARIARNYQKSDDGLDVRRDLCTRQEDMPENAAFIGISVSSLGTEKLSLAQALEAAPGPLHIGGRVITRFIDGTRMILDRTPAVDGGACYIRTTGPLNVVNYIPEIPWSMTHIYQPTVFDDGTLHGVDLPSAETWQWLDRLTHIAIASHYPSTGEDTTALS